MFIAALFTIAKIRRPPKCPLMNKWITKWYIRTNGILYSVIRKNEIMLFAATQMGLEIVIQSEVRKRQILHNNAYM